MDNELGESVNDQLRGEKDLPPITAQGITAAQAARQRHLASQISGVLQLPVLRIQASGTVTPTGTVSAERIPATPSAIIIPAILTIGDPSAEGLLVRELAVPWAAILSELDKDPGFAERLTHRQWEELVAGAYREAGADVILTPPSGDHGRDVIATYRDIHGSIRIIDQVKAFAPDRVVTANDVRALLGVLQADPNATRGFVTTTATFAPGILKDPYIAPFIPHMLDLRDRERTFAWLREIGEGRV